MGNNSTLQNSSEMSQIGLYKPEEDVVLEVKLDKNTIWLSQQQIADLFGVQKSAISKHMKIFLEQENWFANKLFPKWKQLLQMGKDIRLIITIWI